MGGGIRPPVIKDTGLSSGVLSLIKKGISVVLPARDRGGIVANDRMLWSHIKVNGYGLVSFCNLYFKRGLKLKEARLEALRYIFDATGGGSQIVHGS